MIKLPDVYLRKMKNLLGSEFEEYIRSFEQKRYFGLRTNTLKIIPQQLEQKLDFELTPVSWCDEGFYYPESVRPAKSPYYYAGLYYIQEPSAMSTGSVIPIEPHDRVLDLCAAPGGKTTQVAAKLKGTGIIVSNDISATRCKALLKNIEAAGIVNAIVSNETPERLAEKFEGFFNKIIVDAPCSGEGMFRKDPDAVKGWEEHKTDFCCSLQRDILKSAAKMLCDGGIIAYSTCTFAPEEDEGMIWEFLNEHSDFELIDFDKSGGFDNGRSDWIVDGTSELEKCGRLWPYKIKGEGHFLALLRKKGSTPESVPYVNRITPVKDKELVDYYNFLDEYTYFNSFENLELHGSSLISIPMGIDLKGLRILRSGFYLGNVKTKRFEPSQAFAMGVRKEDIKNTIDFCLADEQLIRYLKGESFVVDANDGWNLVCLEGFPLGWGKVQKGRMKNKYLPGWRM